MAQAPRVTVAIPVYNGEKWVGEAVESILAQTFADFELLLLDDGSSDATYEVLSRYRDPRVRILQNRTNQGLNYSRTRLVKEARGEYLANMDHDDIAEPTRLEKQVAYLDGHRKCAAVGSWYRLMEDKGNRRGVIKRRPSDPTEIKASLLFRCVMHEPAVTARTEILRQHEQRDLSVGGDYDLWIRLSEVYDLGNYPEPLMRYRQSADQISRTKRDLLYENSIDLQEGLLRKLGLDPTRDEVQRHFELPRSRRAGRKSRFDREYRRWASEWLGRLQRANHSTKRYEPDVFRKILIETWFAVCWRAFKRGQALALFDFLVSPHGRLWPGRHS